MLLFMIIWIDLKKSKVLVIVSTFRPAIEPRTSRSNSDGLDNRAKILGLRKTGPFAATSCIYFFTELPM